MTTLEPVTRDDLIAAFHAARDEIGAYFAGLPAPVFLNGTAERWSPAHHLDHLIRSNAPVTAGLNIPRHLLAPRDPGEGSRSYAGVRAEYHAALAGGQKAFGRYLPEPRDDQTALVTRYRDGLDALLGALGAWTDGDLDTCNMLHPVLGNISVRELLHFTLYHNWHHLGGVRLLFGQDATR